MKKILLLAVAFCCAAFSKTEAQKEYHFSKHKNSKQFFDPNLITKEEIPLPAPHVVNFTELAAWDKGHPAKKKRRFIEQGEDREREFKYKPRTVPAGAPVFEINLPAQHHAKALMNSPAPTGTWEGVPQTQQLIPPDIRGAAGPTYVMETTNQDFRIYNKTGTLISTVNINTFFNASGGGGYFDPHILYDFNYSKFVIVIDGNVNSGNGNSGLFVAVSQTSDPTGSWYVYGFDAIGNANDFLDYPLLGCNTNWVVISGNDFLSNGNTSGKIYVLERAGLYSGTLGTVHTFTDNNAFTIAPAHTFGTSQTIEYLVQDYNGNSGGNGYVQVGTITGAANNPVYTSGTTLGVNQPWSETSVSATQQGNSNGIEDGDTRMGNAVYINGSLWFCNTAFLPAASPTHTGINWWQINPSALTVTQFGRLEDTNGPKFYYYPSIAVNNNGDVLLGHCVSGPANYSSAAYSFHAATDAANTMQSIYIYKAGTAGYYQTLGGGRNRWGDYTGAAVDPSDNSFWGFGEWAKGTATWSTQVVHVPASSNCGPPTNPTTTSVTNSSATFSWTAVSGAVSYNLQYRVVGTTNWTTVNTTQTTYTVSSLSASTNYEWQVQTVCAGSTTSGYVGPNTFTTLGPPTANFTANVTSTCTGVVNFTDLSTGSPTSWSWNFGDGGVSIVQNPTHTYTVSGTYTVSLTATNTYGSNTKTLVNYITVSRPAAPAASDVSHCGASSFSLSSTVTNPVAWFDSAGTKISSSNPYVTPVINTTTAYYLEDTVPGTVTGVGPVDNTVAVGGYFSNSTDRYLIFNVLSTCTLKSVLVYAQAAGSRVIALRDSSGTTLQSTTINLNAGANTVTLNYPLSAGNNFQLAINGTANLYRNNPGTAMAYPYTAAGLVSITNSSAGTGYYYYFYNWQIQAPPCISERKKVSAIVTTGLTLNTSAVSNVACNGGNTGSANVAATGGTGTYTYSWSSGATTSTATNLTAGTYNVTVADNGGCSSTAAQVITQPALLGTTVNVSNSACGSSNGSASANVTGGTSSYTYLWSNGATTSTISNLASGTYKVTVTDSHSCTVTAQGVVSSSGTLTTTPSATTVSCNGGSNGTATITVTGASGTVTYLWSNGATTQSISNLVAGTYTVTVSASGCTATASQIVSQPATLSTAINTTNTQCSSSTGSASANVSGGTSGYTYLWSNGATTSTINNLAAGTYKVTVTDSHTCTVTAQGIVNSAGSLNATPSGTSVSCNGGNNGTASVSTSGGTGTLSYVWSNGGSTQTISNLLAGTYTVTITDAAGCVAIATQSVAQPPVLSVIVTPVNAGCSVNNGSASASVSGGTSSYFYLWSNGGTTSSISNLAPGNYQLTVTDNHSCTATATTVVNGSSSVSETKTVTNVSCNGNANGTAAVNVSSGTPPYTYLWSNGATSSSISNLTAGIYRITITDGNGCQKLDTVTITEPAALLLTVNPANITCNGSNNGTASINVSGGTSGYTYNWSNSSTGTSIGNLNAGNYSVTVTDANNCTQTSNFTITEPAAISLTISTTNELCYGGTTGSADVTVTGGTNPYSFLWSNGNTTNSASGLAAGNYAVTVTDNHNCTSSTNVSIVQPNQIQISTSSQDASPGQSNGSASVTSVSGAASPYNYSWSNGGITSSITNVAAGSYTVTVTDKNGCQQTAVVVVNQSTGVIALNEEISFSVYPNPATNEVIVEMNKTADNLTLSLKDILGQIIIARNVTNAKTMLNLSLLSRGVYVIEVQKGDKKAVKELIISK